MNKNHCDYYIYVSCDRDNQSKNAFKVFVNAMAGTQVSAVIDRRRRTIDCIIRGEKIWIAFDKSDDIIETIKKKAMHVIVNDVKKMPDQLYSALFTAIQNKTTSIWIEIRQKGVL